MLTIIFLILGIAAVALHLFVTYVVPVLSRPTDSRVSAVQVLCAIVAAAAIVVAILLACGAKVLPAGLSA
jgi:hypothetical protein